MSALLKVGQLARKTNKSIRALHLYEELGLVLPVSRSPGGYRLYPPEAEKRIQWIEKLQDMGMSLNDIRQLISDWADVPRARMAMTRLRELLDRRMRRTERQINRLRTLQSEMKDSLGYLEKCNQCPSGLPITCRECDVRNAPALIAQFHCDGTGEFPMVDPPTKS